MDTPAEVLALADELERIEAAHGRTPQTLHLVTAAIEAAGADAALAALQLTADRRAALNNPALNH